MIINQRITILGAGLIGASWASLFHHFGADVIVWDPSEHARQTLTTRMKEPQAHLKALNPDTDALGGLTITDNLATALDGTIFIQENAPENVLLKRDLFRQIEKFAPEHATLASSTSALTWSELAPALGDPSRLITAHPFNPPHLVPLVELYGTDPVRLDHADALYRNVDRHPVRLKRDATGHIANRLASALWREAVNIVAEDIAEVEAVDAALVHGPGLRWSVVGAHMAYHLGGGTEGIAGYLQHLGPSQERRWASLGSPALTSELCAALVEGVEREAAGRDIPNLESVRDQALIAALKARKGHVPV